MMTEGDRSAWTLDQRVAHERELVERRKAWEGRKKAEDEEKLRKVKRGRMEAWLTNRRQAWLEHTGELPTSTTVEGWKHEYIAERAAEEELEHELRLAEAEDVAAGN